MTSLFVDLRNSIRAPEFWTYSSWLDIVTKYRRNLLGLAWVVIPVAVFVVAIGSVYSMIMGHDREFYIPYLAVGYIVWRFMVQCLTESTSILRGHKSFIMDGRTRLTDFVLRSIAKAFFYFACSMVIVVAALVWSPDMSILNLLTMLLTFPLLVVNMVWVSLCMSLIGARHADAGEMINTALRFGMLLTPILWVGERFTTDSLWWWAVHLNPAYHLISIVRAPVLGADVASTTYWFVGILTVGGWILALFLYRRYARFVPLWI